MSKLKLTYALETKTKETLEKDDICISFAWDCTRLKMVMYIDRCQKIEKQSKKSVNPKEQTDSSPLYFNKWILEYCTGL